MKVWFDTLGCDKNTADNEYLAALLRDQGVEVANRTGARDFDAVIVTTCGFIEVARDQSLETIARWSLEKERRQRPLALFVTGCLSQELGAALQEQYPAIDGLAGVGTFPEIAKGIRSSLEAQQSAGKAEPFYIVNETPEASIPYDVQREPIYDAPYAFLKISDGCDHTCTFCAIPQMKGKHRSIPREGVLAEARRLIGNGVRELNLVAQDASDYGKDLYGRDYRLEHLVRDLCALEGDFWVRLFYLYPLGATDGLLELFRNEPKLCRYVDMPLQHLAPSVLRRMKRPHLEAKLEHTLDRLRSVPGFTIRTTMIVGFPGETEADVQELLEGLDRYQFDRLGVFTYSQEDRTPSGAMPGQVPEGEKRRRQALVMRKQAEISQAKQSARIGEKTRVLIEGFDAENGNYLARSQAEAPEVDGLILIPEKGTKKGRKSLNPGDFAEVEITGASTYDLEAKVVS